MSLFNRIVAALLWLTLLIAGLYVAIVPFRAIGQLQIFLADWQETLLAHQAANQTNFIVAQVALGLMLALFFGGLFAAEIWTGRRRGVRIRTAEGGMAELDTGSIARHLEWRLDQLAEVITVVPNVKSKGGSVDIRLEIETAPDVDVPMKTDEVVDVTRAIIEQDMGLRLGKLDVRVRYAPFDAEWG
jgi:hypothetical protein